MLNKQNYYTFSDPLRGDTIENLLLMIYNNQKSIGNLSIIQSNINYLLDEIKKEKDIDGGTYTTE